MTAWDEAMIALQDVTQSTFGVEMTYTPPNGIPVKITGIFDHKPTENIEQFGIAITSKEITLEVVLSDLGFSPVKDAIVTDREGINYRVLEMDQDQYGAMKWRLLRCDDG